MCVQKCNENEIYIPSANTCKCFDGLGRINGQCQVCPGGSSPNPETEQCSGCLANARL